MPLNSDILNMCLMATNYVVYDLRWLIPLAINMFHAPNENRDN